ncbi:MAG: HAD-IIA family hydrolase [Actinotalea sp.]|nr:HAD-IIA family hydrolase [Actinotalea sp.]
MGRTATPRGLLLDIDGVLVVSWEALPGAADALGAVRDAGLPLRLLTNTTSRSRGAIAALLRSAGLAVDAEEILTATAATAAHLARAHPGARCLLVNEGDLGGDLGDVTLVDDDAAPDEVDVVVLGGAGPAFTYATLNRALACLLEGAALVAMHRNLRWSTREGMALDTGAFLLGLEQAAGVTATVVGKPAPAMFEAGCAALGLTAGDVAMVGDDLDTDVRAAQALGITGVQVRTGKFRPEQLAVGEPPDVLLDSVGDLPAWLGLTRS